VHFGALAQQLLVGDADGRISRWSARQLSDAIAPGELDGMVDAYKK
jgi:hypothetical protein